ncbi:MAG: hypothetical protein LBT63_03540 [Holosporaceae bacterium]|jgi:hypothetical protein|nr:hypothetical protein [Holosporaceae bacterium]
MRLLGCFCFALCLFRCHADDEGKVESKVYADISETAQNAAVSFGGIRGLLGISMLFQKFGASIENSGNFTEKSMNIFGASAAMEYAKEFRHGFLVAVDIGADISPKSKKEGDWNTVNREYESQRGAVYPGTRSGKFETDAFSPNIALKGGYLLPTYKSVIFVKIGVSQVSGVYYYKRDGAKVCDVGVKAFVPSIAFGGERKINNKWGASLEVGMSIKRRVKRKEDSVEHNIKIDRTIMKFMAIYDISQQK